MPPLPAKHRGGQDGGDDKGIPRITPCRRLTAGLRRPLNFGMIHGNLGTLGTGGMPSQIHGIDTGLGHQGPRTWRWAALGRNDGVHPPGTPSRPCAALPIVCLWRCLSVDLGRSLSPGDICRAASEYLCWVFQPGRSSAKLCRLQDRPCLPADTAVPTAFLYRIATFWLPPSPACSRGESPNLKIAHAWFKDPNGDLRF